MFMKDIPNPYKIALSVCFLSKKPYLGLENAEGRLCNTPDNDFFRI